MPTTIESSVARIAGNIASGLIRDFNIEAYTPRIAYLSVRLARAIVTEVLTTTVPEDPYAAIP